MGGGEPTPALFRLFGPCSSGSRLVVFFYFIFRILSISSLFLVFFLFRISSSPLPARYTKERVGPLWEGKKTPPPRSESPAENDTHHPWAGLDVHVTTLRLKTCRSDLPSSVSLVLSPSPLPSLTPSYSAIVLAVFHFTRDRPHRNLTLFSRHLCLCSQQPLSHRQLLLAFTGHSMPLPV